jgi:hypothetical protein
MHSHSLSIPPSNRPEYNIVQNIEQQTQHSTKVTLQDSKALKLTSPHKSSSSTQHTALQQDHCLPRSLPDAASLLVSRGFRAPPLEGTWRSWRLESFCRLWVGVLEQWMLVVVLAGDSSLGVRWWTWWVRLNGSGLRNG